MKPNKYLSELISYGGELFTRAEVIADMQRIGLDQPSIDRWLQGQELMDRIERRRARPQDCQAPNNPNTNKPNQIRVA